MKRKPVEERLFTVSTSLAMKHMADLEEHAKRHGVSVSQFIRALVHEKFDSGASGYLILNDVSPELVQALSARADKLGKDVETAAKDMLLNYCRTADALEV